MVTWLETDGTAGIASTPDSAALSITGDIDLRILVRLPDWSPAASSALLMKRHSSAAATGEWQWSNEVDAGATGAQFTRWRWFPDDTSITNVSGQFTATDGEWVALRLFFDVDDGAGNRVLTWQHKTVSGPGDDIASSSGWTNSGTPNTTAGTTTIRGTAANLVEIGSQNSGTTSFMPSGSAVAKALIISGIAGTVVASPDFTALAASATSYTDTQGNVWTFRSGVTVEGAAQLVYPAAVVEVNSWTNSTGGAADHTTIDEGATPSDADYVESPQSPTTAQPIVIRAGVAADPGVDTDHHVRIRARRNIISGTPTVSLTPVWRTGYVNAGSRGTIIETGTAITLTDTFAEYELSPSSANIANIPTGEYASGVFLELIPNQT